MYSFILFILKGFRLDYGKIPQPMVSALYPQVVNEGRLVNGFDAVILVR